MKKIFYIVLLFILFISFNVKADDICYFKVDNNCVLTSLEDYSTTGTTGTLTYNNTTKLITFDNYTGPGIYIDGLAETVTVKFIGDNIINTPYVVTRDYSSTVIDNLIINGEDDSTLTVNSSSSSYNGLFMGLYQTSLLQVNNMHIYNNSDCGVISSSSNLTEINDSYIESLTASDTTIDSSYGLIINNVEIHSSNDASVTYKNPVIYGNVYLEIYDSKIYASNRSYLTCSSRTYYGDERDELNHLIIENSEFYGENITEDAIRFDYIKTAEIKNNLISVHNTNENNYFDLICSFNTPYDKNILFENNIMECDLAYMGFNFKGNSSVDYSITFKNNLISFGKCLNKSFYFELMSLTFENTIITVDEAYGEMEFYGDSGENLNITGSIFEGTFYNNIRDGFYEYNYDASINDSYIIVNHNNTGNSGKGVYFSGFNNEISINNSLLSSNGFKIGYYISNHTDFQINNGYIDAYNYSQYGIESFNLLDLNKSYLSLVTLNTSDYLYGLDISDSSNTSHIDNSKIYVDIYNHFNNRNLYDIYLYNDMIVDSSNIILKNRFIEDIPYYINATRYGIYSVGSFNSIDTYFDVETDQYNGFALSCYIYEGDEFSITGTDFGVLDSNIEIYNPLSYPTLYSAFDKMYIEEESIYLPDSSNIYRNSAKRFKYGRLS